MLVQALLLSFSLPALSPADLQVPATHLEGEIVVELRQPEAFFDGLAEHGLVSMFRDEEMADLMAQVGPWIAEHMQELQAATADSPVSFQMGFDSHGMPTLELALQGELAEMFPEGLPFGCPDGVGFALKLSDGFDEIPNFLVSAHWGAGQIEQVKLAAEKLLQYGNRYALEHGEAPIFSAASYARTEIWRVGPGEGDDAAWMAFDEGALLVSNSRDHLLGAVQNTSPRMQAGLAQVRGQARPGSLIAYVDIDPIRNALLNEAGEDRREAEQVLNTLGLDSWSYAVVEVRPDGKGLRTRGHLEADGTRGILSAFNHSLPAGELFSSVPQGSQVAAAMTLDPSDLFATFTEMFHKLDPEDAAQVQVEMGQAGRELGITIPEIVDLFGDRMVFSARLAETSVPTPPEMFFEVRLNGSDSASTLGDLISRMITTEEAPLEAIAVAGGGQAWQVEAGSSWVYQPALSIQGDRLRVATSQRALNQWLGESPQPSGMQDVLVSLSHGSSQRTTGALLVDVASLAAYGYNFGRPMLVGQLEQMDGMVPFDPELLPSAGVLERNLPPLVRSFQVHDRGLDFETYGLF